MKQSPQTTRKKEHGFSAWAVLRIAAFYAVLYTFTSAVYLPQIWTGNLSAARFGLLLLRTCGIYACVFLPPALVFWAIARASRIRHPQWLVHAAFFFLLVMTAANVLWNMGQPSEAPILDPSRMRYALWSSLACLFSSAIAGPLLGLICHPPLGTVLRVRWRWPARIGTLAIFALALVRLGSQPGGAAVDAPRPTYLVGLDGATWKVLTPLLNGNRLPNLAKALKQSVYGTLLTYGKPYSPAVWTSIATGKKPDKHGIYSHVIHEPGVVEPVLVGSRQRHAAALWNIASSFGRKVLSVNYYVAYPPELVNGINVTQPSPGTLFSVAPSDLEPVLREINEERDRRRQGHGTNGSEDLKAVRSLFRIFKADGPFDLTILYTHASDDIQHEYWYRQEPEFFRTAPGWRGLIEESTNGSGNPITEHWIQVDDFIGEIMETAGDANLVIVSDHGFRPLPYPYTSVRMNNLLADLGLLHFEDNGEVNFASTTAYSAGSDGSYPEICVSLNCIGREPSGTVPLESAGAVKARVAEQIRAVTFQDDHSTAFPEVLVEGKDRLPEQFSRCDLLVGLSSENRRPSQRVVKVGNLEKIYADYVRVERQMTGTHDNYGIIVVRAKGVSPGPFLFQRTIDTPISVGLGFLNGRVASMDFVTAISRWLGVLPDASTLDIAPTVLNLMGLPVARDMDGQSLLRRTTPAPMVASYDHLMAKPTSEKSLAPQPAVPKEQMPVVDDAVRERLRALGYLQ